jgi:hypothetical protein
VNEIGKLLNGLAAAVGLGGGQDQTPPPPASYPEIATANQRLRDTAKWILTSFAAVGAILVAGLQLSSLGNLTGDTSGWRIFAALLGVVLAAGGVALAIGYTASVFAPFLNTFHSADKHPDVVSTVIHEDEPIGKSYQTLKAEIKQADTALAEAEEHGPDSPEYKAAYAKRDDLELDKRLALTVIGSELLWQRYKRARRAVVAAIALVLAGAVSFAWGANPPDNATKAEPVALGQAPVLLDLHLTKRGVDALAKARGCTTADLQVLSIAGSEGKREVVTIPTASCQTVRFVLTPESGTAIAAS